MAQTTEIPPSEHEKVVSWRLHVLIEAGYPQTLAEADRHTPRPTCITRSSSSPPAARTRPPPRSCSSAATTHRPVKVEATEVDGRKVFSVRAFNQGIALWLERLPTVWVEGEVTELRRQERWASVFFTLKDPESGACLAVQMPRGQFDGLRLGLAERRARARLRAPGALRAARRLPPARAHDRALRARRPPRRARAAEAEARRRGPVRRRARKRPLPRIPRLIGLVTGNDAAAKRDVLTAITTRFPPAHVLVAETFVQGAARRARRSRPRSPTSASAASTW